MAAFTEQQAIEAALANAATEFPGASAADLTAELVVGGVSNLNFRVRLRAKSDTPGVIVRFTLECGEDFNACFRRYVGGGRNVESLILRAAAEAGVGPELLHYDDGAGIMITRELPGRSLTRAEIREPAILRSVLVALERFHRLLSQSVSERDVPPPTTSTGYRLLAAAEWALGYVRSKGYSLPKDMDDIMAQIERLDALVAASSGGRSAGCSTICHTDLNPSNILKCEDGSIYFVDFEYACRAHPEWDLAKLAGCADFTEEEESRLRDMMLEIGLGLGDQEGWSGSAHARLFVFRIFLHTFQGFWASAQEHESSLPFSAEWSTETSWAGFVASEFDKVRQALVSAEMAKHRAALARVRKCVVPVAGLGSRLYPLSKCVPKCFMPVYDPVSGLLKPLAHLTVESAVAAGLDEVCFVAGPADVEKIREYFDEPTDPKIYSGSEREPHRSEASKLPGLGSRVSIITQEIPEGFGDSVYQAKDFCNGEPFVLLLGDHVFWPDEGNQPCVAQLLDAFRLTQETTMGMGVEDEPALHLIGVYRGGPSEVTASEKPLYKALAHAEKPSVDLAREKLRTEGLPDGKYLGAFGAYVIMPRIFRHMEAPVSGKGSEPHALDVALDALINDGGMSLTVISGQRLDVGVPLEFAKTIAALVDIRQKRAMGT
eukprot:gnl/TRDRNA2_/TRDRNA2_129009_c0_seq1.p1 gnl/TRDRNA2_/TRDRNA2_129009_c0~~gnl/TRDRNA2_/TRDRNA2_129009_c0_seq1.p1  ORF type:complete len:676 (-),score=104.31 gnl/TRDRNA2_/TRDRNA2_129009_c0_seq1:86-2065(-)